VTSSASCRRFSARPSDRCERCGPAASRAWTEPTSTSSSCKFGHLTRFDLDAEAAAHHPWFNQTLTSVNDAVVRLSVIEGEFHWHHHDDTDEFFLVLEGRLLIDLDGQEAVVLDPHHGFTGEASSTARAHRGARRSSWSRQPASSRRGAEPLMITRMWRGWTTQAAADDYERFLLDELFPSIRRIHGFRGADVLRRPDGDEVAFVTLVRFEAPGDVKDFAGDDWETPVIEPRAAELLTRWDERASHYETRSFAA
jgi:mannose-6-phosphate isomerase-like protein (cupin superfamily)